MESHFSICTWFCLHCFLPGPGVDCDSHRGSWGHVSIFIQKILRLLVFVGTLHQALPIIIHGWDEAPVVVYDLGSLVVSSADHARKSPNNVHAGVALWRSFKLRMLNASSPSCDLAPGQANLVGLNRLLTMKQLLILRQLSAFFPLSFSATPQAQPAPGAAGLLLGPEARAAHRGDLRGGAGLRAAGGAAAAGAQPREVRGHDQARPTPQADLGPGQSFSFFFFF